MAEGRAEARVDSGRGDAGDVLAFDVGGANIKAADGLGWVHSEPFPLWQRWRDLPGVLERIVLDRRPRRVVATMTGEIADCYPSRADGVADIVAAVVTAARGDDASVGIYRVDGALVPPEVAVAAPLLVAAANWHAVARLAASLSRHRRGLLVDVGSTTTDIVPLLDGAPAALAHDDQGRMATGELVYTGVERTPVAALVGRLPWRGSMRPVASERFAQSQDAWILLGALPERPECRDTADGGPATADAARRRLARMLLADPDDVSHDEAVAMAGRCADRQARMVAAALGRVAAALGWLPQEVVLSGHGGCLTRRALDRVAWQPEVTSLPAILGDAVSRAGPAHAVAAIARGAVP
jgi:probable H4MPT-linked C1 transfer pathway protein